MNCIKKNIIDVFNDEIRALELVKSKIDDSICDIVELIKEHKGRLIITGIGKSGRIGEKIAATLSSVGTPSVFVHATEAIHGDMGIISSDDVVIAITYSGETVEVIRLMKFLEGKVPVVSITGNPNSTVARNSIYTININVGKEACPLNLAPTNSTTATLVVGDALAVALMKENEFSDQDYAQYHPGGSLGRRLLRFVKDDMRTSNLPIVNKGNIVLDVLPKMSEGKLGLVLLVDDANKTIGIFTDGDLRRIIEKDSNLLNEKIENVIKFNPVVVKPSMKIVDAEELMKEKKITTLVVEEEGLQGILQIYNLF